MNRGNRFWQLCCFGLLSLVAALGALWTPVQAHEASPLYIEITERDTNLYAVKWKTPASVPLFNQPRIILPDDCQLDGGLWRCESSLSGKSISIEYPRFNPSVSTLVRIDLLGGQRNTVFGSPDEVQLSIPLRETTSQVAGQYTLLGTEHIFSGYDHLLFVICLLFIAGTGRRILVVITGFTLAHSITLAAAALNFVRVPTPPIEAMIALSVVFLAVEIAKAAKDGSRKSTLTWRYPIAVSATFGLLHGFGFASVLKDIGLPQTEAITALLFFNVGIEIGQIVFIAAILSALFVIKALMRLRPSMAIPSRDRVALPASYCVGILASYWLTERLVGFPW